MIRIASAFFITVLIAAVLPAAETKKTDKNAPEQNPVKNVLLASCIITGVVGGSFNGVAATMGPSLNRAHAAYTTATSDFAARWEEYDGMRARANIYTIVAYSCYGAAAGLFIWWLITPDAVSPPKVSIAPTLDGLAVSFAHQF
ncbi:MAG: hypothetical protein AABZ39_03215 [Spirochaetota bacterium]